jgi:AbrB family looped-hinge helix DNA binding protein
MELGKVQARGQITLPKAVRREAGIRAGDTVSLVVTAPGTVELRVLSRLRLADALERYVVTGPVDDVRDREVWQVGAAKDALDG